MPELDFHTRLNLFAPHDWVRTPLGQWGLIISGGTPSRNVPSFWNGEHPWVTPGEITKLSGKYISSTLETISRAGLEASAAFPLPANSVLVTSRATIGAVAINTVPMSTNQGFKAMIPHAGTDSKYLYYLIKLITPELVRRASGSTFLEISKKDFELVYAPQPPLPEQRRIAEILDTLDRTIEATQRIIGKLQATRQGLLHDLLTRGLDEHGKLRDPQRHPEQFKDTALGRMPVGWDLTSLLDHVELPSGQVDPKQEPYSSMPLIAADHIESRTGRLLKIETAQQQEAISGKYLFESSDVLYSKIRPNLRKAILIGFGGICSADMYPLRSKETMCSGYLILIILGEDFSKFAEAVSMRSGFPKINRVELSEFSLLLPPYEEQKRISTKVNGIDKSILHEQAQLAKLQTLKRGLMEDLLTGRVRVVDAGRQHEEDAGAAVQPVAAVVPPSELPAMPPPLPVAVQRRAMYRAAAGARPEAMSEWTRQLWAAAQGQQVGAYSHAALDAVLPQLVAASAERTGVERIPELLAEVGIRFMLLPHPKGSKASGAAFYLDDGRTQPVVGLSLRYPLLDVFWFNLLHELAHIRLDHEPVLEEALDSDSHDPKSADELAADAFAREKLIPEAVWQPFLKGAQHDSNRIKRLARGLGRHPATVAGRLAFDTGDWRRFNTPELRPNIGPELRALAARLNTLRKPLDP